MKLASELVSILITKCVPIEQLPKIGIIIESLITKRLKQKLSMELHCSQCRTGLESLHKHRITYYENHEVEPVDVSPLIIFRCGKCTTFNYIDRSSEENRYIRPSEFDSLLAEEEKEFGIKYKTRLSRIDNRLPALDRKPIKLSPIPKGKESDHVYPKTLY